MKSIRRPDDGNSFQSKITSYSLSDDDNVNAQSREIVQPPDNGRSLPEFDTKKPGRDIESSRRSFDEGRSRGFGKHFESKIIFVLSSFSLLLLSLRSLGTTNNPIVLDEDLGFDDDEDEEMLMEDFDSDEEEEMLFDESEATLLGRFEFLTNWEDVERRIDQSVMPTYERYRNGELRTKRQKDHAEVLLKKKSFHS